jgi:hypothetical protein
MVRGADGRARVTPMATMFVEERSADPLRRPEWFAVRRSYYYTDRRGEPLRTIPIPGRR